MKKTLKHTPKETSKNLFPVVGIGASGGGLDAFKKIVQTIPTKSGMAYIIVQHLHPDYESALPEILQRETKIPVVEISNKVEVEPNNIYVISTNKFLIATGGILKLSPRSTKKNNNLPIDLFFSSLAEVYQSQSIGVLLSGTGSDGTVGLEDIKTHGGFTFAQDPETAAYNTMPQHAIDTGIIDFILSPEKITEKLKELQQSFQIADPAQKKSVPDKLNEDGFKQILALLKMRLDVDFNFYKQTTIRRRIARRMVMLELKNIQEYLRYLKNNATEVDLLFQDLLIQVTSFFRDAEAFDALCKKILAEIIKTKAEDNTLRVWIPACATGQEAYSIAIGLSEYLNEQMSTIKVEIFATDISEKAITKARSGIYSKAETEGVSENRLRQFFIKTDGYYRVKETVRDMCVFAVHNFLKDPPFARMNLISCRNALIYLEPFLQKKALTIFHYSLNPKGFLFLGKSETIGNASDIFSTFDKKNKFYVRKPVSGRFMNVVSARKEGAFTSKNSFFGSIEDKQMQQHADRLKSFFMQTPALLCILKGPEYVFELANPLYREFVNDPDPVGKKLIDVLPGVKEHGFIEALDEVYRTGQSYMRNEATITHENKEGKPTVSCLDFSYQAYNNEFGKTEGVLVFAYDVTEKVLARRKLEQNVEMTQELYMNSPAFMCTLRGPKHIYDLVNPACQKMFGSKQIMGKPLIEVLPGVEGQNINKAIDKVYQTGEIFVATEAPLWLEYDEGLLPEERYFNFSGQPMYDENKKITAIQVIGYEVTQEVLSKKKSEANLKLMLESIPQITFTASSEGIIIFFNQFALDYLGLTIGEATTGKGWKKILHPDEFGSVIRSAKHSLTTGEDFYKELRLKRSSDDKYRWHLMRVAPIKDDKRTAIISWVGVANDIQEQKIKEQKKDEFISIASHEMKTPLTSTKGYLQLLEKMLDGNNREAAYLANKALGSVNRLNRLINELLEVNKIQYGRLNFNLTTFDFNKMVDDTIEDQRNASPGYTIIEKGKIASEITGDRERLQQVVINLIGNGIKYSPGQKRLVVTIKEKNGDLIFSVKDNGIGISKENFENVFKRYFRVEDQAMQFHGMGIGLYISNQIIKRHGGRMWVESERGKGSTFNFSIPLAIKQ